MIDSTLQKLLWFTEVQFYGHRICVTTMGKVYPTSAVIKVDAGLHEIVLLDKDNYERRLNVDNIVFYEFEQSFSDYIFKKRVHG